MSADRISRRINAHVGDKIIAEDGVQGEITEMWTDDCELAELYEVEDIELAAVEWPDVGRRVVDAEDFVHYYEVAL